MRGGLKSTVKNPAQIVIDMSSIFLGVPIYS
jgi:hypothetical protein